MALPSILSWQTLTGVIDKWVGRPDYFQSYFTQSRTHETPLIRMDYVDDERVMAPLVRAGGEAFKVRGYGWDGKYLKTPTIKVKFDINPADYLTSTGPGEIPLLQLGETGVSASVMRRVQRDLTRLEKLTNQTKEWLCAQALLEAKITYETGAGGWSSGEGSDVFHVDFGRDSDATVSLSGDSRWATKTGLDHLLGGVAGTDAPPGDPTQTHREIVELMGDFNGLAPTMCLMGANVGKVFQKHIKEGTGASRSIMNMALDMRRLSQAGPVPLSGEVDPISNFIFEGTLSGIDWITYTRKIKVLMGDGKYVTVDADGVPNGTTRDKTASGTNVPLVPPNSCYFIAGGQNASRVMEYGPIEDWEAVSTGTMKRERFVKSFERQDPSGATMLMETHPLPVPYLPEAVIKVNPLVD